MPYEGQLVKMESGRWARFQWCRIVNAGHQDCDEDCLLVAVELEAHYQELLAEAERTIERCRRNGMPVSLRVDGLGAP